MEEVKIFEYNGSKITFLNGNGVMVNATEMAKSFGKEVRQWFDNESTHAFIHALSNER